MMAKFNLLLTLLILISWLSACQPPSKIKESSKMNQQQEYILHFGEQGVKDFIKYGNDKVDHQPAGASFRDLDFTPPNLGKIKIKNGNNDLLVNYVFSVLGTQFAEDKGIQVIDINAGLTQEEFVDPELAYQAYSSLMKQLNESGWQNYFYTDEPRISKENNIKYLSKSRNVIDPSYIFSYEEWLNILNKSQTKSLGYRLYANGIILDISLKQTNVNNNGNQQFMVRFSFQTVHYVERNLIPNSDQMTSAELEQAFKKRQVENREYRETEEKKAITEGYNIDDKYVDPDIWQYIK